MQIIDAQIHLWASGLPNYPSHWQVTHFTAEEAIVLMDEGGVDAAVIHPPDWDPGATELAFKAVRDYPGRFAIMGWLPLDQPGSRARIVGWRQQPGMLGLRYNFLHDPARRWLANGTIDWLWAEAEKAGVPIYMLATDSLAEIARIAERHPALRLTIAHLGGRGGLTALQDHAAMTHMPRLLALAKYRTWRWRRLARQAIRRRRIRFRSCRRICAESTTCLGHTACSGGRSFPRCPAHGVNV